MVACERYQVERPAGIADRLVLRCQTGDQTRCLAIARYRGPELPATLTDAVIAPLGEGGHTWRLTSREGQFDFEARAVDEIEERASLYSSLHRPFELRRRERLIVQALLALLHLPAGARWLRHWQAKRTRQ